ncbi:MAG: hypothetical protein QXP36_11325, partial [Conexivisphaerales archaeon]
MAVCIHQHAYSHAYALFSGFKANVKSRRDRPRSYEELLKELAVRTGGRVEFRDITREVEEAIRESGVRSGIAIIFTPHTTTG